MDRAPSLEQRSPSGADAASLAVEVPKIEAPKGGGAVRGIGEKFAANPVTGTGSMSIPIAASPGRAGFGPQLTLSYDSGAGNGPFGLGWSLSLPAITRKTDRGIPRYRDAAGSDTFVLSGAEDLVPVLVGAEAEGWTRHRDDSSHPGFVVERFRPRVEGLFARIERWTATGSGEVHWRSVTRENLTTVYGRTAKSRIADPADPSRVFSWLICQSNDDKGNAMVFEYVREDSRGVKPAAVEERHRTESSRSVNLYPDRIRYGNRTTNLDSGRPQDPAEIDDWMFELVFDYGQGRVQDLEPAERQHDRARVRLDPDDHPAWRVRPDPFSSYRSGFEVRTYRRCERILMVHHFPALGSDGCLVRSTDFGYADLPLDPEPAAEVELAHQGSTRYDSVLRSARHSSYLREPDGTTYLRESTPPAEFDYSQPVVGDTVTVADPETLEDLPRGLDGTRYRWVDLDGEGMSGVLTEQDGAWYYKRNLSPLATTAVDGERRPPRLRLAPAEVVKRQPSMAAVAAGSHRFVDLAGDGQLDVAWFAPPVPGFSERTEDRGWAPFVPFRSVPNLPWAAGGQQKFVDLTGDGHADVLCVDDGIMTWYPSLGESGFGPAEQVQPPLDDPSGPRLVLGHQTDSIYFADLSGDGLSDLVRIHNGEVCYWPNLGYGRFGAKVTMGNPPWFDHPDQFDQRRIRLADIDGSGVTDIVYLGAGEVRVFFNQSGNAWSEPVRLRSFPPIDDVTSVVAVDLLGNGTACLVWSSPLPGDARQPLRYLDLMGGRRADGAPAGQKPHLLVRVRNNLGATTGIEYAPSTKFYLQDARAGRPWRTRLPFPVHCVERVTVTDKWQRTSFSTRYSYHHGYFDGVEREFRGFGRVDQIDVEDYGTFAAGNPDSPYVTGDRRLYQPPVKTVSWFHTGAPSEGTALLRQYADEYFPAALGEFAERELPPPDLGPGELDAREWREAMRACKGIALRVETYELDVDALRDGEHRPVKLFTVAQHNCHIRRLQPRLGSPHAAFLVTESEAVTYHHDLDLTAPDPRPDPRVTHSLNLTLDEHGNVLQAVTVGYPRLGRHDDPDLPAATVEAIAEVQHERHVAQVETRMTADIDPPETPDTPDTYRLRVPCEVVTSEITGIEPRGHYFTIDELRDYQLSDRHQPDGREVWSIPYHRLPTRTRPERRMVEHVRTVFFAEDLTTPLPLGEHGRLGLTFEAYKLALTDELLAAVIGPERLTPDVVAGVGDAAVSGYLAGTAGDYWIRSGVAGFADDAAEHFYLPERYTDPFGNTNTLSFDPDDLYLESSSDPLANQVRVKTFDYRILAPSEVEDINGNLTEVAFDVLGRPVAVAVKGKGDRTEGDHLDGFGDALRYLDPGTRAGFFTGDYHKAESVRLLGTATARHIYSFGAVRQDGGQWRYEQHCPAAASLRRTQHVADDRHSDGVDVPAVLAAFAYSSGTGQTLLTKSQAEPGEDDPTGSLRWIVAGKTVVNNKGNPVKQYEPYFTDHHRYQEPVEQGVTPLIFYDAVGRVVRTEHPDGTVSRVELTPWHSVSHDPIDTVAPGNRWYEAMTGPTATPEQRRAAEQSLEHAGTPSLAFLDTLGREVIAVAHNRTLVHDGDTTELVDARYVTVTKLDAEGKPLWIRDARGNLVMQYIAPPVDNNRPVDPASGYSPTYDIAGNLLFQHSMDAGDRWMVLDASGQPLFAWDVNDVPDAGGGRRPQYRRYRTVYDALRRPVERRLQFDDSGWFVIEKFSYGDDPGEGGPRPEPGRDANARGQVVAHWDASGLLRNLRFDFKGNILESTRQLVAAFKEEVIDWGDDSPTTRLEDEEFRRLTEVDALDRMRRMVNWHSNPAHVAVYEPTYDERGSLRSENLTVGARLVRTAGSWTTTGGETTPAIAELRYNARGQRVKLAAGNGMVTEYEYDPDTFRLSLIRTVAPSVRSDIEGLRSHLAHRDVVQQSRYFYDAAGNITEIRDDAVKTVFFDGKRVEPHSRYRYDAIGRLIEAHGRESASYEGPPPQRGHSPETRIFATTDDTLRRYEQRYTYDSVGNISVMQHIAHGGGWTRTYGYATDSNRLDSTEVGDAQPVQYLHDTHGNMLNLTNTDERFHLAWDPNDMIRSVDLGGGGVAYYSYRSDKQRNRKVITTRDGTRSWERIYLDGFELYRRYSGPGRETVVVESHHLLAGDQRLLLVDDVRAEARGGPRVLYRNQVNDHLGSSYMEVNQDRAIITYETYHPYGTSAFHAHGGSTEVNARRYRYTGMERDTETGLSYHTARHYAPCLGLWCSPDPLGVGRGLGLFSYADGNPVVFHDLDGMDPSPFYRTPESTAEEEAANASLPWVERPAEVAPPWRPGGSSAEISAAQPGAYRRRWTQEERQVHRDAADLGYYNDYHYERWDVLEGRRAARFDEAEPQHEPSADSHYELAGAGAFVPQSRRERRFREDLRVFQGIREEAERQINSPAYQRYIASQAQGSGRSFPLVAGIVYHQLATLLFYRAVDAGGFNYDWRAAMTRQLRETGGADFRVRVRRGDWRSVEFTTVTQSQGHALRERARIYGVNQRGEYVRATQRVVHTYDPHRARRVPGGERSPNPPMPSPDEVRRQVARAVRQHGRARRNALRVIK